MTQKIIFPNLIIKIIHLERTYRKGNLRNDKWTRKAFSCFWFSHWWKRRWASITIAKLDSFSLNTSFSSRWGLFFRLLPLCWNPTDFVGSSRLDFISMLFSSWPLFIFSLTWADLFLFVPFSIPSGFSRLCEKYDFSHPHLLSSERFHLQYHPSMAFVAFLFCCLVESHALQCSQDPHELR